MDESKEDYDAPQFFDFVDGDGSAGSSFFDRHNDSNPSLVVDSLEHVERRGTVPANNVQNQDPPAANGKRVVPRRKACMQAANKPVTRKPAAATIVGNKRKAPVSIQKEAKRKRIQATTPECLKRSQNNRKVVKSSEQLELERIKELRKQTSQHLQLNKKNMNKVRALKPIVLAPNKKPVPQLPGKAKRETVRRVLAQKKAARPAVVPPVFKVDPVEPSFQFSEKSKTSTPYVFRGRQQGACSSNVPMSPVAGPSAPAPEKKHVPGKKGTGFVATPSAALCKQYSGMSFDFSHNQGKKMIWNISQRVVPKAQTAPKCKDVVKKIGIVKPHGPLASKPAVKLYNDQRVPTIAPVGRSAATPLNDITATANVMREKTRGVRSEKAVKKTKVVRTNTKRMQKPAVTTN